MASKRKSAIVGLIALCTLLPALLILVSGRGESFSERENRALATMPRASFESLISGNWMEQVDSWYEDRFPARDQLLALNTAAIRLSGKDDNGRVYFGQDRLYFYEQLNWEQLLANSADLEVFAAALPATQGQIRSSLLLVPSAAAVLPDALPTDAPAADEETGMTEVYQRVSQAAEGLQAVPVLDVLQAAAGEADLYFTTDHHWTQEGAWIAYQAWAQATGREPASLEDWPAESVSQDFRGTLFARSGQWTMKPDSLVLRRPVPELLDPAKLSFTDRADAALDVELFREERLDSFDQYQVYLGGNHDLFTIHNLEADSGDSLLLIKDSYANALIPYLLPHFARVTVVDARYLQGSLNDYLAEHSNTDCLILYGFSQLAGDEYTWKLNR